MLRFLSGLLLISAASILLYTNFPIGYYLQPKQVRLYNLWKADFQKLEKDEKFKEVFKNIGKIEMHFTDPQVASEFGNFSPPFKATTSKPYTLKISITRWIDQSNYGYVIEHELFDQTDDKIYEFGRTYSVGKIF